jgi:hypothetical protein
LFGLFILSAAAVTSMMIAAPKTRIIPRPYAPASGENFRRSQRGETPPETVCRHTSSQKKRDGPS